MENRKTMHKKALQTRSIFGRAAFCAALMCASALISGPALAAPDRDLGVYPPWSGGANDPVQKRGLEFTVPEVDNLPDFHGDPCNARLSIFVGGNYYFAMAPLVAEFEKQHPELKGKVYYETIPPGLLAKQIEEGGTITVGNMTWTVHADVYAAGLKRMEAEIKAGYVAGPAEPYVTNTLTIMVPKGNPANITTLKDLAKPGVRLVMPNPEFEGIGRQIKNALAKAGGEELVRAVYETKVKNGETLLTHIHHRQSPLWLMQGKADAGVTWQSEALFQEQSGNPISHVAIPDEQNATGIYAAGVVKGAPHTAAAREWIAFLKSPAALEIFKRYGFKSYEAGTKK
jgi:molybdenum ABC transporter molybdate-binding protein